MIYDVHAHLDMFSEEELEGLINRARKENVKVIITNSVNMDSIIGSLEIKKKYFDIVKLAIGLYPDEIKSLQGFNLFEKFARENVDDFVAIGEIGLDLYHSKDNFELQKEVFVKELFLARELSKPVIVHTRKAEKEVLDILEDFKDLKVVLHCFSGNFKLVRRAEEMGFYFSIPANVVRSEHFQKMVREVSRDKILTETDSPYLSPYLDKKNESSFINETISFISKILGVSIKEVEAQVEKNYFKIF